MSFSLSEVELSKLIPPVARICYVGLKILRKDYLEDICEDFSSYHLKCLFLNTLETTDPEFWFDEENIEAGFHLLLYELIESLVQKSCPHFWIPSINLYEHFSGKEIERLITKLIEIKSAPEIFIDSVEEREEDIAKSLAGVWIIYIIGWFFTIGSLSLLR